MEPWVPKNDKHPSTKLANVFETNEGTANWDAEDPPQVTKFIRLLSIVPQAAEGIHLPGLVTDVFQLPFVAIQPNIPANG